MSGSSGSQISIALWKSSRRRVLLRMSVTNTSSTILSYSSFFHRAKLTRCAPGTATVLLW